MRSGREDTVEERYAIKFCFKLGKNVTETYGMLQTAFGASCMNQASVCYCCTDYEMSDQYWCFQLQMKIYRRNWETPY